MTRPLFVLTLALCLGAPSPAAAPPGTRHQELQHKLDELRDAQNQVLSELRTLDDHPARRPDGAPRPPTAGAPADHQPDHPADDTAELLRTIDPDMLARLERLRETNPERADRMFAAARRRLAGLRELKEKDPEAFAIRLENMQAMRRAGRLAARVATLEDAGDTEGANLAKAELRAEAEAMFDRILTHQREQTRRIEHRLATAKQSIAEMQERRDERITERVDEAIERARARLHRGNTRPAREPRDSP